MGTTSDPTDPGLGRGVDDEAVDQNETYLVLSEDERAKGFVRPLRNMYEHAIGENRCGGVTTMAPEIAETFARDPQFYGATYCSRCNRHRPVGEFAWYGTQEAVGT